MRADLEQRIQKTGEWLYKLIEGESPTVFQKEFWLGKMLEWCMRNDSFRIEMFRFIDVFPYLTTPETIIKHLQEYLCKPGLELPSSLQWGVQTLTPSSFTARMVAKTIINNVNSMAKQFIVGNNIEEALPVLEDLRSKGFSFTADLLGEAVVSETEAEEYKQRYLHLLDVLSGAQKTWSSLGTNKDDSLDWGSCPKVDVSIKPSAMYSQMNPAASDYSVSMANDRLRPILLKAIETGSSIMLDMEHRGLKNLTLALFKAFKSESEFRDYPHFGIVIQSYLKESENDLVELLNWARTQKVSLTIRLVKGAYWDSEVIWAKQNNWPVPVFTIKHETDANFEKLARMILLNQSSIRLACASHNIRSISYVVETAKELKVPQERLEYQVLYGMGEPVRNALRKAGLPTRIYTPIGEMLQGMAYLVRRLLENTANESFLRQSFWQGVPLGRLLQNPLTLLRDQQSQTSLRQPSTDHDAPKPFRNEPRWDWTLSQHRQRFTKALEEVRKKFPQRVGLRIGGQEVFTGREIKSINPNAIDDIVGMAASAGEAETTLAIKAAKAAFPAWRDTDYRSRAEVLFRAAESTRKKRYDLAALQVLEAGKSWSEADADVCEAIDFLEYYGREMLRLGPPRRMGHAPGEQSILFYEPRGICAVIAPWNFPLAISVGMTSAAIVTGNTVVYKPASQTPITGALVYELFENAGLPPGVLNFLPGPGSEIGDLLVTHPDVCLVAFTGSREVGTRIIELAARVSPGTTMVRHVIAEMGGKNAIIVDADADLDEAVSHIVQSAFGYQGQKCSACSRVIVLDQVYPRLVSRLKEATESIEMGPVEDPKNIVGAVIDRGALEKIENYINIGKREAELLIERHVPNGNGFFAPLAVFTDLDPQHRLAQEEIFGPVLVVLKVKSFEEAIEVANQTQYALTGSVFSRSPENINRAYKDFRVGNLYINRGCTGALVERHPFGGFKMSGVGSKAGGPDYLQQFMIPRNVVENMVRRGFAPLDDDL